MRITKIKLHNYRCYYGEQVFEIPDRGRIVVIRGENGAGKTALLTGLTWCLYNEKIRTSELINDKHLDETAEGEHVRMSIEVHFTHLNSAYILRRNLNARKEDDRCTEVKEEYTLERVSDGALDRLTEEYEIACHVNNILNESVKSFFFFDGAQINTFTREEHNRDVEVAVKNLLKIEALKRARDHIRKVAEGIRGNIRSVTDDTHIEEVNSQMRGLEEKHRGLEGDLSGVKVDIKNLDTDIANTEKEIGAIERNSVYREQKSQLQENLEKQRTRQQELGRQLAEKLNTSYLCFATRLFREALSEIDTMVTSGQEEFHAETLRDIIRGSLASENGVCLVCEQELSPAAKELLRAKLPRLITERASYQGVRRLRNRSMSLRNEAIRRYESIASLRRESDSATEEVDRLAEGIRQCQARINDELPDAHDHRHMLGALRDKRDRKLEAKNALEEQLAGANQEYLAKEEEYNAILARERRCERDRARIKVCADIRKELDELYQNYEREEIGKINSQIKEIFDSMIRKEGVYRNVFIDDKYALNVERIYSKGNVLRELSYGERQILSLSLILSLAKVSGDEGPFVMDTPMGNLDPIHRRKLIACIPQYVDQLFLLVTSSEFTRDLYELCNDSITCCYVLGTVSQGMTAVKVED